jgi:N-acetylglucosaminyl-diphospho-decaprenol L-rhamnosyltransferase
MKGRVGVVLVTYNSQQFIGKAIESCLKFGLPILVVDNASSDATVTEVASFTGVTLLRNDENRGFAGAVNQGFRQMDCEAVLLLNPDAYLVTDVEAMVSELKVAAAVGGMLVGADGKPQQGFAVRRLPTAAILALEALGINRIWRGNPLNRRYRCLDLDLEKPMDVDQPAGAFLMVRREAWLNIGGFDEQFFPVWFEDVDFCLRLKKAGYRIRYTPKVIAGHEGGHSVRSISDGQRQLYWYGSLLRYAAKHFQRGARIGLCAAVAGGSILRMITIPVLERSLRPFFVYVRVIRLAFRFV